MGNDSGPPRLSRRGFARGAIAGGAAVLAGPSARAARAVPARQADGKLVFAVSVEDLPRVQPLLDDYAAQSGVVVEGVAFLYRQLNVALAEGTCAYDVVSMDDPWMPLFAGGEFLTGLERLAVSEGVELDTEDFVPGFLALGTAPGVPGLRALPWIGNLQVFAWRTDVLAQLGRDRPATWDDVVAIAEAVADAGLAPDLFGVGLRGEAGNSAATTFLPILRGHGVDVFDAGWEPQLETEQAGAAMATLLALAALAPPGVADVGHEALGQQVADGRIAQAADIWPNQVLKVYDPARSRVAGKVAIGAEPAQPGVEPSSMTGTWLLGLPAGCGANARAALEFVRWLTAPEQQRRLMLEGDLPATRLSVLGDQEIAARLPFLPGLLEAAEYARPRPRTHLYPAVEEILGHWVAQAIRHEVEGPEALTLANREIRDLLVREGILTG